jgi:UDP-3-O-[3-hydroxymyristoyl] glucosamine N-acyltransferase
VAVALREIAGQLGGELIGDGDLCVERIAALEGAPADAISFLANPRLKPLLGTTLAACVIVRPEDRDAAAARGAAIVTSDPYLYYARLSRWWAARLRPRETPRIHPTAIVDPTATIGRDVAIGPLAVVEAGAVIGDGAAIGAHVFVGARARIGTGTRLHARVVFAERCSIGARCIVHPGAVIGADGFGFAPIEGRWEKIEQLGAVTIGDDVDIGANTCIDRGALDDTVIGDGVKLDNQIQIGHNVRIGAHTAMAACAGVAGSAVIGAHCMIGGAALILGHVTIGDRVQISAGTFVMHSIDRPGHYSGIFPIDDNAAWQKNAAALRQLHALRARVRALERSAGLGKDEATPETP